MSDIGLKLKVDNGRPPLVSVVVVCYNHARFVRSCLDSIRAQVYTSLDLIIVDDASTDTSCDVISCWLDESRLLARTVFHKHNIGLCRSLNEALSLAKGVYFAIVAADDLWLPDKISRLVALMEQEGSKCGVAYSDALRIDEGGGALPGTFMQLAGVGLAPVGWIREQLLAHNFIPAMSTLVRRECYYRVGGYDEKLYFEDWDMWLRISASYKFVFASTPLAVYRWVDQSMSHANPSRMAEGLFVTVRKQLESASLSGKEYAVATATLARCAALMWESRARSYRRSLWLAWRYNKKLSLWAMSVMASTGFSWMAWQRVRHILRGLKK